MRAVVQRVSHAAVTADGADRGQIGQGLFILLGVSPDDREEQARFLAAKISKMRIFSDENGRMNRSLLDIGGCAAVVSNFTLYANATHGNRPDFFGAASPEVARGLYEVFVQALSACVKRVISGVFGADMQIDCTCDGPVTILLDTDDFKGKMT